MFFKTNILVLQLVLLCSPAQGYLVGVPTVPFTPSAENTTFLLKDITSVIVDSRYANTTDTAGSTLIPPTLYSFAETFAADITPHIPHPIHVKTGLHGANGSIFLTLATSPLFLNAAGRATNEAYTLTVGPSRITLTGATPLGVWWGTRTLLQQLVLNNNASMPTGTGTDAAGWGTRGVMLDAARHFYPPAFIVELCAYLSFFKQNTLQLHLSDNLYNNPNYTSAQSETLYAAFRLWSDAPELAGLNRRRNESYTRDEFEGMQRGCAERGVTVTPEIEAPGHALVITQWRPEIAIEGAMDLLNLSKPEATATMEMVWGEFLPWIQTKVVSIGADEYVDAALTENALETVYTTFVNSMNDYISSTSGKSIRIWGTFPPSGNSTNVNTSVAIQHWANFEDDAYYDFIKHGYNVLNSDDSFYVVAKYSGSYPQVLNLTRVFHGSPDGTAFAPNIFNTGNASDNPSRADPAVLGHVAALWNDYGPNATVYSEAYYSWRDALPALADKQWGGQLTEAEYTAVFSALHAAIPGQNLDRRIKSNSSTIVSYAFNTSSTHVRDRSGNGYHAHTNCSIGGKGVELTPDCSVVTPLESKGRNYTLSFSVYPTSSTPGQLFGGRDSQLLIGNGTSDKVMLVAAGNAFALNYTLPVREWTHANLIGRGNRTFLGVGNGTELQFLTRVGVNGEYFVDREIAVEAPLTVMGGGFEGFLKGFELVDYA